MNDGPGPHKRPSSIETKQSIHRDEWGVDTNNNNNNSNIGGPYSYFSFIHMYAVTQTHTYGTDTMANTANIPLGTPTEGSWEQGWLTKHGGKGGVNGAGMEKKSWHHVNATATMIRDERPSPPIHNQHIIRKPISAWTQKTRPGNLIFHHILPCLLHSVLLCCSSRTRWVQGVLVHMGVISLRGLTFKLIHYMPEATSANGTWGIQIRLKQDQSDKGGFAIYQAFTSQTLKVGFVMMLASDRGSVFTNYTSCRENVCRAYESRRGLKLKDEIQLWQEQDENPIVRHHYCNLPQNHGQAQPQD